MRYAILRLEEEIRIVLDVRRTIPNDPDHTSDQAAALLIETSKQLRDLVRAVRILERVARGPEGFSHGFGETTLTVEIKRELVAILGFTTNSEDFR